MNKKITNASIYTILSGLILWNYFTGRLTIFLHPRMVVYLMLASIGFILLAIYSWYDAYLARKRRGGTSYKWVVLTPYLVFFMLIIMKPTEISAEAVMNKSTSFTLVNEEDSQRLKALQTDLANNNQENFDEEEVSILEKIKELESDRDLSDAPLRSEDAPVSTDEVQQDSLNEDASEEDQLDIANESNSEENRIGLEDEADNEEKQVDATIGQELSSKENETESSKDGQEEDKSRITAADDFMETIVGINDNPDDYIGKTFTLDGFVYRETYYPNSTAVVSRLYVSCCAADASVLGIYVLSDDIAKYEKDQWLRVTGTLSLGEFYYEPGDRNVEVYTLENPTITPIDPYPDPYVYYNY